MLVGSGRDERGDPARLRRARHAERRRPRRRDAGAARRRLRAASRRSPRSRRGTVLTRVPIRYRRGAELALVAGRTVKRIVPRGQRDDVTRRVVGRPDDVTGPVVAGPGVRRRSRSSRTAAWWGACRSSRPPASRPRTSSRRRSPGSPARCRSCSRSPCLPVPSWSAGSSDVRCATGVAPATGPAPHDHHRHPQHRDRQDAVGAELPARPPSPHRRADDDAGRQGRQRRARAQGARAARDRDGLHRRRDRHPHRRPAHAAVGAAATSCASARSRAPTPP